jgi:phosphatidylserine/phosphatidylglycerophosphate/cardiolipin synthase-like enzyme
MLSGLDKAALAAFAPQLTLSAAVLRVLAAKPLEPFTEREVAKIAGLPAAQEAMVLECLRQAEGQGMIARVPGRGWRLVTPPHELNRLADLLEAAGYYAQEIHQDQDTVWVALTRPARPSRLEAALEDLGVRAAELEATDASFVSLASQARERLRIMTPFLDRHGAEWVCDLFAHTAPHVRRELILRYASSASHTNFPEGLIASARRFRELGVVVFDYALLREGGKSVETFHAKLVLADTTRAYVGSSNMTWGSLEHSMELGLVVTGVAAKRLAILTDAIARIATQVKL